MQTLVKILVIIVFGHVLHGQSNKEQSITVKITNLENNKGKVYISLYNSESNFLNSALEATFSEIEEGKCEVNFKNIPTGVYAISFFHDENDNGKMDYNALGIPKEDYGCSNNARGFMGPPKWEDAKFQLNTEPVSQIITL